MDKKNNKSPELSVILPCRNEEQAVGYCIKQIKKVLSENKIYGEIIVSDSSSDKSPEIAKKLGVILIKHDKEGYGNAYLEAFEIAKGKYIFMADCDGSYDFNEIPEFLKCLKEGYDFVVGDRFKGKIDENAMPFSHRYIGNPVLSFLLRLFFKTKVHDVHCGMRAITKESLNKLNLKTTGMEFASEMVIKAAKKKLKIKQISINYCKRKGESKLKPFADAWKHLRFMLLYSPLFLFFIPGIILFLAGAISIIMLYFNTLVIFGVKLQYHPMFLSSLFMIIGYQLIIFAFFAKTYAINHLGEESLLINQLNKHITIETASIVGVIVSGIGAIIYLFILIRWVESGFGALQEVKNSIIALTLIIIGIQTIFSSFMLSILGIKEK
ncbi:MAG: glycosyltransferase family 2 protein [Nanoarchaeota archaeon]|nr:glycosyltransferase family 2 protein [Nanoarchaeota archaeon]